MTVTVFSLSPLLLAGEAGRTGRHPAGTSGRTFRSGPGLDGHGLPEPDRTSGPVRFRPDASGVRSFPKKYLLLVPKKKSDNVLVKPKDELENTKETNPVTKSEIKSETEPDEVGCF